MRAIPELLGQASDLTTPHALIEVGGAAERPRASSVLACWDVRDVLLARSLGSLAGQLAASDPRGSRTTASIPSARPKEFGRERLSRLTLHRISGTYMAWQRRLSDPAGCTRQNGVLYRIRSRCNARCPWLETTGWGRRRRLQISWAVCDRSRDRIGVFAEPIRPPSLLHAGSIEVTCSVAPHQPARRYVSDCGRLGRVRVSLR